MVLGSMIVRVRSWVGVGDLRIGMITGKMRSGSEFGGGRIDYVWSCPNKRRIEARRWLRRRRIGWGSKVAIDMSVESLLGKRREIGIGQ